MNDDHPFDDPFKNEEKKGFNVMRQVLSMSSLQCTAGKFTLMIIKIMEIVKKSSKSSSDNQNHQNH